MPTKKGHTLERYAPYSYDVFFLEVALVGVIPPNVSAALVARDAVLAGVLLVEKLYAALYAFCVGVVSIRAVDDATNAFRCVDVTVALVDQSHEELRITRTALLSPTFVR